jgi:23S rRNA pseudouridine2605 synthase
MTDKIRLQKFLSHAGIASRRSAEKLMAAGRVKVNGKVVTELGTRVDPDTDNVQVDEQQVQGDLEPLYFVMNKPPKTVCTEHDPQGRKKVVDLLPPKLPRVFTVGRLDYHTEGLLVFTNDGELAQALMHPENAIARIYHVKLQGGADPRIPERFAKGVRLEDGTKTRPTPTELLRTTRTNCWYEMILTEGKNRQIHRMCETLRRNVLKLKRVRYGPILLGDLPVGQTRSLKAGEVNALFRDAGLKRTKRK